MIAMVPSATAPPVALGRRMGDQNAELGRGVHVHVVHADGVFGDDAEIRVGGQRIAGDEEQPVGDPHGADGAGFELDVHHFGVVGRISPEAGINLEIDTGGAEPIVGRAVLVDDVVDENLGLGHIGLDLVDDRDGVGQSMTVMASVSQ